MQFLKIGQYLTYIIYLCFRYLLRQQLFYTASEYSYHSQINLSNEYILNIFMPMQTKIFISGSCYKEGDIQQRVKEENLLKTKDINLNIYNPIKNKSKISIDTHLKELIDTDAILFALDDICMASCVETGICYGINFIKEAVEKCLHDGDVNNLIDFLESIPTKKIFAHHSDIRIGTAEQYEGNYIPYGIDQLYVGAVEMYGEIHGSAESAIDAIVEYSEKNE